MRIYDNRETFYQWDLNQKITSDDFQVGDEIHFSNSRSGDAPVVKAYVYDGIIVADVPNILLQKAQKIYAYHYVVNDDREYTIKETVFTVTARPKPADYVYTETEILTYVTLEERIGHLEQYGVNDAKIKKAVDQYFEDNPFVFDETDPTVPEWAKAEKKPKYTAEEVGALPADTPLPPLKFVTSLDFTSNDTLVSLRSLESNTYVLRGRFVPFKGSNEYITFNSQMIASLIKRNVITYLQVFYPENNTVQYYEITDSEWRRVNTDLVNMESVENKVTEIVRGADDTQYPSARAAYNALLKKEDTANKVTEITAKSTDEQYPSAKATFTELEKKESTKNRVSEISEFSTDKQYPTAKAVYDWGELHETTDNKTTVIDEESTHEQYPTAKAVFDSLADNTGRAVPQMSLMDNMMFEKFGTGDKDYFFSQANWDDLQRYNRAYVQCYDEDDDLRLGDDGKGMYALKAICRFGAGTVPRYPWMKKSEWAAKYREANPETTMSDEEIIAKYPPEDGDFENMATLIERQPNGFIKVPTGFPKDKTVAQMEGYTVPKKYADQIKDIALGAVQKVECPDKNRYAYTTSMNSKGESVVSLIKMGANPTADVNQPLIRRRANGAVGTLKMPEADDDSASKYYVDRLFNGANKAVSYKNYTAMANDINELASGVYKVGQNIMIETLDVPDLWVSGVFSTSVSRSYGTDEGLVNDLKSNGYIQLGYYKLSPLETQKVDLTDYVKKDDSRLGGLISSAGNLSKTVESDFTTGVRIDNVPLGRNYLVRVKIFGSAFPKIYTFPLYIPPIIENGGAFQTDHIIQSVTSNVFDRIHIDGSRSYDGAATSYVRFFAYLEDASKVTRIEYTIL